MKTESSEITNNFQDWSISYAELFPMQKTKTKVIKGNCNPVWNDELTLTMKDPKAPIHIVRTDIFKIKSIIFSIYWLPSFDVFQAVYDKDKFSNDDSMGMAEIDVKPYIECLRMGLNFNTFPNGTKLERVHPKKNNYLADQSCIVWENGKIVQDMVLRLRDVECGEVVIQIELVPLPGRKLHV